MNATRVFGSPRVLVLVLFAIALGFQLLQIVLLARALCRRFAASHVHRALIIGLAGWSCFLLADEYLVAYVYTHTHWFIWIGHCLSLLLVHLEQKDTECWSQKTITS